MNNPDVARVGPRLICVTCSVYVRPSYFLILSDLTDQQSCQKITKDNLAIDRDLLEFSQVGPRKQIQGIWTLTRYKKIIDEEETVIQSESIILLKNQGKQLAV